MNLPTFSVHRPVFTTMITLMVLVLGIVSLSRIRIDLLPEVELPTVSIRTGYSGASPEVMERMITQILEEIVATVPGVEEITSSSSEGRSDIRVTFAWGTDVDAAALDLQATIEDEINELPDDIVRPSISKYDINSYPVVILGVSSNLDPVELTELIETQIRYRFARVPGVAQVDLFGGYAREVRIELDPDRVKAMGLPLDRVIAAVRDANLDLPAGRIEEGRYEVTLRAPAEYETLDEIRNTVIQRRGDTVLTVGQVAEVQDTYERIDRIVRVDGRRGLRIGIRKEADANTVEVSRRVLEEIEAVNQAFPQVRVVPVINQGNFIERSIANVTQSILYGGGLAIVVLLFFLRNLRSTLIISVAIPISVVATFALIYFGGFTLNLMSLGGLALGVGMMVDSSVVVLENIFRRHQEEGEPIAEAAVTGAREVETAIVASTLTTLVVFLPLIYVRGVAGLLFRDLAFVVMFSLFCSLMVALSLIPVLAAKLLRHHVPGDRRRHPRAPWIDGLITASDTLLERLDKGYRHLLRRTLPHPWRTVLAALALLGGSLLLLPFIGSEFLPPSDEGEVRIDGEMEVGTRLELVDRQARAMEAIVFPAVPETLNSVVSVRSGRAEIRLALTPADQRARSNADIADDLRERLEGAIPGMEVRVRAPQGQFLLDRLLGGEQRINVEVRGFDLPTLDALARNAADKIIAVTGITDIETIREAGVPQQEIRVDRRKLADVGLSARDVTSLVETAIAGARAGDYRAAGHSYRILVQLKDAERRSLDEVLDLTLTTPSGEAVALRNLVQTEFSRGPGEIERKDQQRQVTVRANVDGRDLGSVARDVQDLLAGIPRPMGYDLTVGGSFEEQQESFRDLMLSLALALVFVYMVLACQYESLKNPLVVMLSVPFATIGVLLMLFLTNTTLNLQSYIGCIMLGGIVVNSAILLVDQAARLEQEGLSIREAVAEAGRRRLRPILMTTLTTCFALMPLAFGIGEGADAQAPLARAVVGGLAGATVITLLLIPAVYVLFHAERRGDEA